MTEPKTQTAAELISFIDQSPTPFHAVQNALTLLVKHGFTSSQSKNNAPQKRIFFTHNDSSLIAISLNAPLESGFRLLGAHTDSPCLKIKPNASYESQGYLQLGVEVYGGALLAPWFDRDLSIAGRVSVSDKNGKIQHRLINFKRPIASIASLAIHLNRGVNDTNKINKQTHLPPLLNVNCDTFDFNVLLIKQLNEQYPKQGFQSILAHELSLFDTQLGTLLGLDANLIASARLDNLLSSFVALKTLLNHKSKTNCVVVLNDHEEVGSSTASGAGGPFLATTLRQLCKDEPTYQLALNNSMMISVDNAHAVHPNYSENHEPNHQPKINAGPVIKTNHNQRYATNSETHAVFAQLCQESDIPYQQFVVRSDMGCGSTIGPITATELGIRTVDIGVPQLAMHSIRELAGAEDCDHLLNALSAFINKDSLSFS